LRRLPILEPAFRSISSLRLRSIFQLNLPADFQLAPSFNLPVPPSNLTSDSHRPLIPSALPSANLRLALPINFPALPDEPNVRLRMSHLRLCFPANLRLASSTSLSALPSNSTSDSSTTASLRRCLPVNLQLSLTTNLPALPDGPTFDSSALHLWRHFRPIFDLRLRSTFGYLRAHLQLALAIGLPAEPFCRDR
jgi:hypothetical protein